MHRVGVLVEGLSQPIEVLEELGDRLALARIHGRAARSFVAEPFFGGQHSSSLARSVDGSESVKVEVDTFHLPSTFSSTMRA